MSKFFTYYSHHIVKYFKSNLVPGQKGVVVENNAGNRQVGDEGKQKIIYYSSLSDKAKCRAHKLKCSYIIVSNSDITKYKLPLQRTRTSSVNIFDFKVVLQGECEFTEEDRCTLCMGSFNEVPEDVDITLLAGKALDEFIVVRTPCKHYFHKECLSDWMNFDNQENAHNRINEVLEVDSISSFGRRHTCCPVCRFDISNFKLICTNLGLPMAKVVIERA